MRRIFTLFAFVSLFLCLGAKSDYPKPTLAELMKRVPTDPVKGQCAIDEGLEDQAKECTPGAVLTTSVVDICHGVSTKKIRPPSEYTDKLKIAQIIEYGYTDTDPRDYEEDHLISLEIGGHPDDPTNLWPEPHEGAYGSLVKDKVENWLHKQICSRAMTPQEAQKGIVEDWRQYIDQAGAATHKKVKEVQ